MLELGMSVKIGMCDNNVVTATVTDVVDKEVIAYCNHFQKPYYLCFKLEDLNEDFEVLDYAIL